jgi:F-type H+-transporting ATPase subunit epsilon
VNAFSLQLLGANGLERIEGVTSFVAEEASGSFGVLAGHVPMMAALTPGLARFRQGEAHWHYLAAPGALVHFSGSVLTYSSRRYFQGEDAQAILDALQRQMDAEAGLHPAIESLQQMERDMLKRLWELQRRRPGTLGPGG